MSHGVMLLSPSVRVAIKRQSAMRASRMPEVLTDTDRMIFLEAIPDEFIQEAEDIWDECVEANQCQTDAWRDRKLVNVSNQLSALIRVVSSQQAVSAASVSGNIGPHAGDRLLNIREIAAKMGVCLRTVRRLIAGGQLPPPVKVGRASRWHLVDIEKYVDSLKSGAA